MKVLTIDVCEHCKQFPEDVIHALWLCPEVLIVWSTYLMWSFRQTKHFPKILDLVKHVIEENKDLDGFAMIIWTFWFQRNRLRIENRPFPIIDVISMANNILAEFIKAILVQPNDSSVVVSDFIRWSHLAIHLVKVNFDEYRWNYSLENCPN